MISIIIPVYNAEKYIKRCLESIENQIYRKFEVILINDGSTDKSLSICQGFIISKTNYILYSQENKGPSSARNKALDLAKGNYITFLDADDWLHPAYLETLYFLLKNNDADISMCEFNIIYEDNFVKKHKKLRTKYKTNKVKVYNKFEALSKLFIDKDIRSYPCGKLIKKEKFDNIRFPEGKKYEDIYIMFKVFEQSSIIVKIDSWLYNYIQHDNNITSKNNKNLNVEIDFIGGVYEHTKFINNNRNKLINLNKIRKANAKKIFKSKKKIIQLFDMESNEYKVYENLVNKYLKEILNKANPMSIGFLLYLQILLIIYSPKSFLKFIQLTKFH